MITNLVTHISTDSRKAIADGLCVLLADTYTLYLKTHNFHWNVKGSMFFSLHLMFENQYTELALAVDAIAERIRALGFAAPATYVEFQRLTTIPDAKGVPGAREMILQLIEGQEIVVRSARSILSTVELGRDEVSANLLADRMTVHEKNAWMLRSLIEE